jgi:hypothetical protein
VSSDEYKTQGLQDSNFNTLLLLMHALLGGPKIQTQLLSNHVKYGLSQLSPSSKIAEICTNAYTQWKGLGSNTECIETPFWQHYEACKDDAFAKFATLSVEQSTVVGGRGVDRRSWPSP